MKIHLYIPIKKGTRGAALIFVIAALCIGFIAFGVFLKRADTTRANARVSSASKVAETELFSHTQNIHRALAKKVHCWVYSFQCLPNEIPASMTEVLHPISMADAGFEYSLQCLKEGPSPNCDNARQGPGSANHANLPKTFRLQIRKINSDSGLTMRMEQILELNSSTLNDYAMMIIAQRDPGDPRTPLHLGASTYGAKVSIFHDPDLFDPSSSLFLSPNPPYAGPPKVYLDPRKGPITFKGPTYTDVAAGDWTIDPSIPPTDAVYPINYAGGLYNGFPRMDLGQFSHDVSLTKTSAAYQGSADADLTEVRILPANEIQVMETKNNVTSEKFRFTLSTQTPTALHFTTPTKIVNSGNGAGNKLEGTVTIYSDKEMRLMGPVLKSTEDSSIGLIAEQGNIVIDKNARTIRDPNETLLSLNLGQNPNSPTDTQGTFLIEAAMLALDQTPGNGQVAALDPALLAAGAGCKGSLHTKGLIAGKSMPFFAYYTNNQCSGFLAKQVDYDPILRTKPPPGFIAATQQIELTVISEEMNAADVNEIRKDLGITRPRSIRNEEIDRVQDLRENNQMQIDSNSTQQ